MHIALIGMSGVRAHDLELTDLGTSLPASPIGRGPSPRYPASRS